VKPVIIESPFAGDVERNLAYARRALRDSLRRGEAPIASHLLYPQVLDEDKTDDRVLGIAAGFAWWPRADSIIFYTDLGWSPGMEAAYLRASHMGFPTEERLIGKEPPDAH